MTSSCCLRSLLQCPDLRIQQLDLLFTLDHFVSLAGKHFFLLAEGFLGGLHLGLQFADLIIQFRFNSFLVRLFFLKILLQCLALRFQSRDLRLGLLQLSSSLLLVHSKGLLLLFQTAFVGIQLRLQAIFLSLEIVERLLESAGGCFLRLQVSLDLGALIPRFIELLLQLLARALHFLLGRLQGALQVGQLGQSVCHLLFRALELLSRFLH
mmetsp:Transcript_7463/g.11744  ORF Transcript_7463/g.11744 Transcript_7463/m.11744 type:complete len:210 (-) Transcript_7463:747-1376(-)